MSNEKKPPPPERPGTRFFKDSGNTKPPAPSKPTDKKK